MVYKISFLTISILQFHTLLGMLQPLLGAAVT